MMRACHVDAAMQAFRDAGFRSEVAFPHWIAKAHHGEYYLDIIYNSGNGLCPVDDDWFHFAPARRGASECPPCSSRRRR